MDLKKYEFNGEKKFEIKHFATADTGGYTDKTETETPMRDDIELMKVYQDKLFAEGKEGILIIFQAMDAAGKDGAIKHVFSGLNPQGVDTFSRNPRTKNCSMTIYGEHSAIYPREEKSAFSTVLITKMCWLAKCINCISRRTYPIDAKQTM